MDKRFDFTNIRTNSLLVRVSDDSRTKLERIARKEQTKVVIISSRLLEIGIEEYLKAEQEDAHGWDNTRRPESRPNQ